MEGRAIARPNPTHRSERSRRHTRRLQWRAEQSLGQTVRRHGSDELAIPTAASMEGRAIARPNWSSGTDIDDYNRSHARFNGGPSNRSAKQYRTNRPDQRRRYLAASMEGRAIARPNVRDRQRPAGRSPSNMLQWRAEQSLGQTRSRVGSIPRSPIGASMEGRAIARPNTACSSAAGSVAGSSLLQWRAEQSLGQTPDPFTVMYSWSGSTGCFNGGPSNRSAKLARPPVVSRHRQHVLALQWRAEQSLGQTLSLASSGVASQFAVASMEGRAIARPNRSPDLGSLTCPFAGLCERSRKRELRRCLDSVVKLRFALCHKGSSGP